MKLLPVVFDDDRRFNRPKSSFVRLISRMEHETVGKPSVNKGILLGQLLKQCSRWGVHVRFTLEGRHSKKVLRRIRKLGATVESGPMRSMTWLPWFYRESDGRTHTSCALNNKDDYGLSLNGIFLSDLLHEVGHMLAASPRRRTLPEFALGENLFSNWTLDRRLAYLVYQTEGLTQSDLDLEEAKAAVLECCLQNTFGFKPRLGNNEWFGWSSSEAIHVYHGNSGRWKPTFASRIQVMDQAVDNLISRKVINRSGLVLPMLRTCKLDRNGKFSPPKVVKE